MSKRRSLQQGTHGIPESDTLNTQIAGYRLMLCLFFAGGSLARAAAFLHGGTIGARSLAVNWLPGRIWKFRAIADMAAAFLPRPGLLPPRVRRRLPFAGPIGKQTRWR